MSRDAPAEEGYIIEPDVLQVLAGLFEAQWDLIRPAFASRQQASIEAARTVVARLVLHIAHKGVTNPEVLREQLHRMVHHVYADILRPIQDSAAASRTTPQPKPEAYPPA